MYEVNWLEWGLETQWYSLLYHVDDGDYDPNDIYDDDEDDDEDDDTAEDEGKRLEWGLETQWCPRHKALPGEAPSKGQNWTHGATFLAFLPTFLVFQLTHYD